MARRTGSPHSVIMQGLMPPLDPGEDLLRKNLKTFREQAGYSRAQLSELSGVPEKNIIRYEGGETGIPAAALMQLAIPLGRDPGHFYMTEPPPAPSPDDLPAIYYRTRPGVKVPDEVQQEVREAIDRANARIRKAKQPRK